MYYLNCTNSREDIPFFNWVHATSAVCCLCASVCVLACPNIDTHTYIYHIRDASTWGDGTCLWSVDTGEKIPSPHALGIALLPQVRGFSKKKKDKKNKHGRDGYDDEAKALRLRIVVGLRGNAVCTTQRNESIASLSLSLSSRFRSFRCRILGMACWS